MKENKVKIIKVKTIYKCNDCPDFIRRQLADPYDWDDRTPDKITCRKTGEDMSRNGVGYIETRYPIPDTCPRLKNTEEKEREL